MTAAVTTPAVERSGIWLTAPPCAISGSISPPVAFVGFGLFPLYMMITTSLKTESTDLRMAAGLVCSSRASRATITSFLSSAGAASVTFVFNSLLVTLASSCSRRLARLDGRLRSCPLSLSRQSRTSPSSSLSTRFAPPVGFIVPIYLMVQRSGLLDTQLALIIVYTSMNLSLVIWVLRGFFLDIPIEIEEAALVDGYTRWQIFLRVALPLVRPGSCGHRHPVGDLLLERVPLRLDPSPRRRRDHPGLPFQFLRLDGLRLGRLHGRRHAGRRCRS